MRDSKEGIRSVILDSVFPPQVNGVSDIPTALYGVLEQIAAFCATSSECNATIPDMLSLIEDGIARLEDSPVEFSPEEMMTGSVYIENMLYNIYNPEAPNVVQTIATGTEDEIRMLDIMFPESSLNNEIVIDNYLPWTSGLSPEGMAYPIVCAEEYAFVEKMAFSSISNKFRETTQAAINNARPAAIYPDYCKYFPAPAAPAYETEAVVSDIPTMILASNADSQTPTSWSKLASETLSKSQYLEFDGLYHILLGQGETSCIKDLTLSFLTSPEKQLDSSCIADEPVLEYIITQ